MRRLLREDLAGYASFLDPRYIVEPVHHFVGDLLQRVARREINRLIINMPPRHGKSRAVAVEFPTWLFTQTDNLEFVTASYSTTLSTDRAKEARARISDPLYAHAFPNVRLNPFDRAADDWRTTNGCRYRAVGVGSSFTGGGADFLVIDDPHKDFEESHSETMREKVWNWFLSVAYTRLSPAAAVIVIATRWHVDDLIGRLLDPVRQAELAEAGHGDEKWTLVNLPGIAKENDPLGRKPGEALSPRRYPAEVIRARMAVLGHYLSAALYDGTPVTPGGNYIAVLSFQQLNPDQVPPGLRWMRYWDLATSSKTSADFTAGGAGAIDKDGNFYLRDMILGQWDWPVARRRITQTAIAEQIPVGVEAQSAFKTSFDNLREDWPKGVPLASYTVDTDKLSRAIPWFPLVENKKFFLVRGDWVPGFLSQCEAFPNSKNDDMADVVSGLWKMLREGGWFIPIGQGDRRVRAIHERRRRQLDG